MAKFYYMVSYSVKAETMPRKTFLKTLAIKDYQGTIGLLWN